MDFLKIFIPMLLMVIVVLLLYNTLRVYVLYKVNINKWIILALAAVAFLVPNILWPKQVQEAPWQYLQTGVFLTLFLWFADVSGLSRKSLEAKNKKNNKNNTVIRSKAKPSRVNSNDMEVIKTDKKKKK